MTDFGFTRAKSSTVNLDEVDTSLYRRILQVEPDVRRCMECGSCSAVCTAAPLSGMSVRKVIHALERGVDIAPMLSGCMLCGKCTMVCPRGINTRHLILSLERYYKKEEKA
ncbi:MAG: (4Fe-4S)-binding protein [Bacteroidales bacterium]|nr:(4Fe-4S)-binding protein [Bacteroidales bacterium]